MVVGAEVYQLRMWGRVERVFGAKHAKCSISQSASITQMPHLARSRHLEAVELSNAAEKDNLALD